MSVVRKFFGSEVNRIMEIRELLKFEEQLKQEAKFEEQCVENEAACNDNWTATVQYNPTLSESTINKLDVAIALCRKVSLKYKVGVN